MHCHKGANLYLKVYNFISLTCGMRDLIELLVQYLEDLWLSFIFISLMLMYALMCWYYHR